MHNAVPRFLSTTTRRCLFFLSFLQSLAEVSQLGVLNYCPHLSPARLLQVNVGLVVHGLGAAWNGR
jgi:hypothetical protein